MTRVRGTMVLNPELQLVNSCIVSPLTQVGHGGVKDDGNSIVSTPVCPIDKME